MFQNGYESVFRFIFWTSLALMTVAVVVGSSFLLWLNYTAHLQKVERPSTETIREVRNVGSKTLERLGSVATAKVSSFINFEQEKTKGVIRIGVFGDSFSYGDEVDEESDYATQLQRLLRERGVQSAEVLNFGSSWHGFGQTYIMWDEVGRHYDLDYVLLGPVTFFPARDTRFNHTDGISPYYLHSRFILDRGNVQLVDVIGHTHSERFRNYYGFLSNRRYLLYDRGDPPFLRAMLPTRRYLGNPFYYYQQEEEREAVQIYRRLIERMKASGTPVVLATYPWLENIRQAAADLVGENLCAPKFERPTKFPNRTVNDHNSATGNVLLARQFMAILLGQPIEIPVIHTIELEKGFDAPRIDDSRIDAYEHVAILSDGVTAGVLVSVPSGENIVDRPSFFKDGKFASLLSLKLPGGSPLDGVFLASHFEVASSAPARIEILSKLGTRSALLGRLRPFAGGLKFASLDLPGLRVRDATFGPRRIVMSLGELAGILGSIPEGSAIRILVGEQVVLEGTAVGSDEVINLSPVNGEFLLVNGSPSKDAATLKGRKDGTVDILFASGPAKVLVPVARWRLENSYLSRSADCTLKPLPTGENEKIVVVAAADEFEGAPLMRVYLNENLIGEVNVAGGFDNWQVFTFSAGRIRQPAVIRIELANDRYDEASKRDRNLYIKDVYAGWRRLPPEDGVISSPTPSAAVRGQPTPVYNGSLTLTLADQQSVDSSDSAHVKNTRNRGRN